MPDTAAFGECADAAALVRKAQQGCEAAFADLVHLFAERLFRFFRARGVGPHDAEDLVQDTFVKVYRALARYDEQYSVATWIFTIARRRCIDHFRTRRSLSALPDEGVVAPDDKSQCDERTEGLWGHARATLSDREYEVLWLRYGEDMSVKDAARVMELSAVHARVLLHRARRRLAERLKQEESPALLAKAREVADGLS